VTALTQWPDDGIPANPGAWLTAVAKRRAIDRFRRDRTLARQTEYVARETPAFSSIEEQLESLDQDVGDDMLRLTFIACHPVLSKEARVALTLRLVGGLSTSEIARAFLSAEATIAQRIVRAKRTLREARVPFELPPPGERLARVASVAEVIYLVFNEGYAATSGEDVLRPALCADALRLGRALAHLLPDEAEVHGLVALMELQCSRAAARTNADGEPVLLADQDRRRWDRAAIRRGLASLDRASRAGPLGPYGLQAAIAAAHARALRFEETDWEGISALYDALAEVLPTPVVHLNRAVAVSMAFGPAAALPLVDALALDPALREYHLLPAVKGDLLERCARYGEAADAFAAAALLAGNERERALLQRRALVCRTR
jgi:RNA polymerase sigma factor (sigma-70 family)